MENPEVSMGRPTRESIKNWVKYSICGVVALLCLIILVIMAVLMSQKNSKDDHDDSTDRSPDKSSPGDREPSSGDHESRPDDRGATTVPDDRGATTVPDDDTLDSDKPLRNQSKDWKTAKSLYQFTATNIDGDLINLNKYKGHPLIILNASSKANQLGTDMDHYEELKELYDKLKGSKNELKILAFLCNQFNDSDKKDETNVDFKEFITTDKKLEADLFTKVEVTGEGAQPLWKWLYKQYCTDIDVTDCKEINHDFTIFVVDKMGHYLGRFEYTKDLSSIERLIKST
ncbi:VLP1 [Venturia canescens]|uniref:VLP1 n=1 Tax=Venturia canescens TaxID=32260 RepID=A0ACB9ZHK9_9HYME|nr:glutathione peroxidase 1-like [Venturia canescens]KAI5630644.1 VLP1 [Venturia canescens]